MLLSQESVLRVCKTTHKTLHFAQILNFYLMHAKPKCDREVSVTAVLEKEQSGLHTHTPGGLGKLRIRSFRLTM